MNDTKRAAHVERLNSISKLKAEGFIGVDVDIETSLFEYGLIWRKLTPEDYAEIGGNPSGKDAWLFVHRASHGKNFDRSPYVECDLRMELLWVDWAYFFYSNGYSAYGLPLQPDQGNWGDLPFPQQIKDLVDFYGVENVFGTTYWNGFEIKKD